MALGVFFLLVGILASEVALFGFLREAGAVAAGSLAVACLLFARLAWRQRRPAPPVARPARAAGTGQAGRARLPVTQH